MKTFCFVGGPLDGQSKSVTLATFNEQVKISRRGARSGKTSLPTIREVVGDAIFYYRCPLEHVYRDSMTFTFDARWTKKDGLLYADELQPSRKTA